MKLCVALDLPSKEENLSLIKNLSGLDLWLKIGLRSYLRDGKEFINEIKNIGDFKIFLDLKIYDIPNTMADACEEIANLGVDMINIHASAGITAMKTVMQRLNNLQKIPFVLAVSALTSFDNSEFKNIYNNDIENSVKNMSQDAFEAGLDGMVCSVYESKLIKNVTNDMFLTLTPGIRPFGEPSLDQKRIADINMAKKSLSDFIVVGRPIYQSNNPKEVCEKILAEL